MLTFELFWIAVFLLDRIGQSDDRGSPAVRLRQFLSNETD